MLVSFSSQKHFQIKTIPNTIPNQNSGFYFFGPTLPKRKIQQSRQQIRAEPSHQMATSTVALSIHVQNGLSWALIFALEPPTISLVGHGLATVLDVLHFPGCVAINCQFVLQSRKARNSDLGKRFLGAPAKPKRFWSTKGRALCGGSFSGALFNFH